MTLCAHCNKPHIPNTEYVVAPRPEMRRSVDLRAAADAINRRLMDSGQTRDREAAEREISECHPLIAADLVIIDEPQVYNIEDAESEGVRDEAMAIIAAIVNGSGYV